MTVPRTREQLEQAAAEAEEWLDNLDPDDADLTVDDPADLRAVGQALAAVASAEQSLAAAVAASRKNGRSWARIAAVLGVSKQAASRRYADALQQAARTFRVLPPRIAPPRTESPAVAPVRIVQNARSRRSTAPGEFTIEVYRDADGMYRYQEVRVFTSTPYETEAAAQAALEDAQRFAAGPAHGPVRRPL
jgi:hypothetical protein